MIESLVGVANELGLDHDQAAKFVSLGVDIAQGTVAKIDQNYAQTRSEWRDQVASDPVIGTKEAMAIADKGLEAYGSPALRKLLDETGIGDHPEVIRAFHKIGKTVLEDTIEKGGSGDKRTVSAADAMYPTMK